MDDQTDPQIYKVPPGLRIYAVGDVHGRADLLEDMLTEIETDSKHHTGDNLIIMLGDYIDRGHATKDALDILIKGSHAGIPMHCIRGNHEDIILRFFNDNHSVAPGWFHYGGLQTLRSYGINVLNATQDFEDIFSLRRQLDEAMPVAHKEFLTTLPYIERHGGYLFVHAGVHPERPLHDQDTHHLMWMREPFLSSTKQLPAMIVHGHSIRLKPEVRVNRIGIDTGAYVTGHLTCVVLQDSDVRFIHT